MGVGYSRSQSREGHRYSPGPGKAQTAFPLHGWAVPGTGHLQTWKSESEPQGPAEEMAAQSGNPGRRAEGGELPGSPASAAGQLLGALL